MALSIPNNLVSAVTVDYRVYSDGDLLIGVADEITLPKVTSKKTTWSGAGIGGDIDAPVVGQFESLELSIKWNSLYSNAGKMMNPNKTVNITIRAAQQCMDKNGGVAYKQIRVVCGGYAKEFDPGSLKRGETMGATTTLELTKYLLEVDGEEQINIDKLGDKYIVDGEDLLADITALI